MLSSNRIIKQVEALPNDHYVQDVWSLHDENHGEELPGMLLTNDLKSLAAELTKQLAEAREVIEHYGDEGQWMSCIEDGSHALYRGFKIDGYDKAQEYLSKYPNNAKEGE